MKPHSLLIGLLVAGCTAVGPDYQRPDVALETRFSGGNAEAIGAIAQQRWWLD